MTSDFERDCSVSLSLGGPINLLRKKKKKKLLLLLSSITSHGKEADK